MVTAEAAVKGQGNPNAVNVCHRAAAAKTGFGEVTSGMPQRSEKSQQVFLAAVGILTQNLLGNHKRLHLNRLTCEVGTQRTTKLRKTGCLQVLPLI